MNKNGVLIQVKYINKCIAVTNNASIMTMIVIQVQKLKITIQKLVNKILCIIKKIILKKKNVLIKNLY